MSHDPDIRAGSSARKSAPLLGAEHRPLIERLAQESGALSWRLSSLGFAAALERSAEKSFGAAAPEPQKLEEYLCSLHLQDLALATACIEGLPEAWEHFVATYRPYLRAAAGAILRCPASLPAACDLADSLFAALYGLKETSAVGHSLFAYFHGRSSLKTWLRAVLAQRHIDAIRAGRRFRELSDDSDGHFPQRTSPPVRVEIPADPRRRDYVAVFTRTLEFALALLTAHDKERLRLYYVEQKTLAEIGRTLGEHESSVSRSLDRIRRELRHNVEQSLRKDRPGANGSSPEPALSEEQIALCFEYAAEDVPIDFDKLFSKPGAQARASERHKP